LTVAATPSSRFSRRSIRASHAPQVIPPTTSSASVAAVPVAVSVTGGRHCVSGEPLPGDAPLREAVEEAGYEFGG
jgi:hypothetical protein